MVFAAVLSMYVYAPYICTCGPVYMFVGLGSFVANSFSAFVRRFACVHPLLGSLSLWSGILACYA